MTSHPKDFTPPYPMNPTDMDGDALLQAAFIRLVFALFFCAIMFVLLFRGTQRQEEVMDKKEQNKKRSTNNKNHGSGTVFNCGKIAPIPTDPFVKVHIEDEITM